MVRTSPGLSPGLSQSLPLLLYSLAHVTHEIKCSSRHCSNLIPWNKKFYRDVGHNTITIRTRRVVHFSYIMKPDLTQATGDPFSLHNPGHNQPNLGAVELYALRFIKASPACTHKQFLWDQQDLELVHCIKSSYSFWSQKCELNQRVKLDTPALLNCSGDFLNSSSDGDNFNTTSAFWPLWWSLLPSDDISLKVGAWC